MKRIEELWGAKRDTAVVKYFGTQSRVSEILNRKRNLTLKMVKALYRGLKIPAEVLLD